MKGTGNAYIGRIEMLFVGRNGAAYCVQGSAALASDDSGGHALEQQQLSVDRVSSRVSVLFCKFSSVIGAFLTSRTIACCLCAGNP